MVDSRTEAVGAAIRDRRTELGLTLEELGGRVGVSRQTVSRLERGDGGVALAVVVACMVELDMDEVVFSVVDKERN